jgi:hypothetical protein
LVSRMLSYHVLCKTLSEHGAEALLDEVSKSECILVGVSAGEALVRHVEEGEVLALLDGLGNLQPLLLGRVNTSGVVSASVEKHDAALGEALDVLHQAVEVKANGVLVVVSVLLDLQARVLEDSVVIGP